jgi:hypothetical protein
MNAQVGCSDYRIGEAIRLDALERSLRAVQP